MEIGLVTPLRNEIEAIDSLFDAIEKQDIAIALWIIIENGSSDGSKEALKRKLAPKNVKKLLIFNEDKFGEKYELGLKYSSIVKFGFDTLLETYATELDFIGILDADCFPEPQYYSKLEKFLSNNPAVGITSGNIYLENGELDSANKDWVRGGCRLWKMACFEESGYVIAPSADAVSTAKAALKGWDSKVCHDAKVFSREVGSRINYRYYGYATYYRGCSMGYAVLKSIHLFFKSPRTSYAFVKGYFGSFSAGAERIKDQEVFTYFNNYLYNKIFKK